jgi:hypothetical protein
MSEVIILSIFVSIIAWGLWWAMSAINELAESVRGVFDELDEIEGENNDLRRRIIDLETFLWRSRPTEGGDHE